MSTLPNPESRPLLTVGEAATLLGVSRSTAYRRVEDGTLPVLRLGERTTRVITGELLRMLGLQPNLSAARAEPSVAEIQPATVRTS